MSRVFSMALAFGLVAAGCAKEPPQTNAAIDAGYAASAIPSAPTASGSAAVAPHASAMAQETDEQPPTERRAERKAAAEISHANYKGELTKLEKELGGP